LDQMLAADVGEMGALFVGGQPGADALRHQHHQRAVAETQPVAAADQPLLAIAGERVFLDAAFERWAVELRHWITLRGLANPDSSRGPPDATAARHPLWRNPVLRDRGMTRRPNSRSLAA